MPAPNLATDVIDAAIKIMSLSYEQERLLILLKNEPDTEASELCKRAQCSWDELYVIDKMVLDLGVERVQEKTLHPSLTRFGTRVAERLEKTHAKVQTDVG